jgi:hypothetical protein
LIYFLLAIVIIFSIIVPIFSYQMKPLLVQHPSQTCGEDEIFISFYTNRNAWIHVVPQQDLPQGISIPYATLDTLTKIVNESPYHFQRSFNDSVKYAKPGHSIGYVPYYYLPDSKTPSFGLILVVINTIDLPESSGFIQFCGTDVTTKIPDAYYIKTYVSTALNQGCTSCGIMVYDPIDINLSGLSLSAIVFLLIIDCIYSIFLNRSKK